MTERRHVPFGAEWAMPVDVSVSEWVVARGAGWSCGQCPLDPRGEVVAPGDIDGQAVLVADRIEAGLGRAGLAPDGVLVLIVYGVSPWRSAELLRDRMPPGVPVVPVGVPPLYYDGMTLEVDVLAAEGAVARREAGGCTVARSPGLTVVGWAGDLGSEAPPRAALAAAADRGGEQALASMLALPRGAAVPEGWTSPSIRRVPEGAPAAAVLMLGEGPAITGRSAGDAAVFETAEAGPLLRVTAWCADPTRSLGQQADVAMSAIIGTLAARGLGPEALVKISAHHVGEGAAALHDSLSARHRYHGRPGPASTGLGVAGLDPEGAAVIVEAIAAR